MQFTRRENKDKRNICNIWPGRKIKGTTTLQNIFLQTKRTIPLPSQLWEKRDDPMSRAQQPRRKGKKAAGLGETSRFTPVQALFPFVLIPDIFHTTSP